MKISVFGLGYVGVVTAACLAKEGHKVVGVDVMPVKVDMVNAGQTPIIEEGIDELVKEGVEKGALRATSDTMMAVEETDLAIVCVGTPSCADGSLENRYISQVIDEIGVALRERETLFHVVVRSTMVPGTLRSLVIPTLEKSSGRAVGDRYEVIFHPEFLRESTSVYDFYHPPKIVVGERVPGAGELLLGLYGEHIEAPRIVCPIEVAEMVKYCDNLFHAVKVTFANEVGQFCHAHGIDSQEVMSIFCEDKKLNISHRYLKPGFAFGGSCLPKDIRAFLSVAQNKNLSLPMLGNVIPSNQHQIERALELVLAHPGGKIGFHGVAFKAGTDDMRESPLVELAERLIGKGRELVVYDEKVQVAKLLGGNKSYVQQKFPHLAKLLTDQISDLEDCEVILIGHAAEETQIESWLEKGRRVIDLTGRGAARRTSGFDCVV